MRWSWDETDDKGSAWIELGYRSVNDVAILFRLKKDRRWYVGNSYASQQFSFVGPMGRKRAQVVAETMNLLKQYPPDWDPNDWR